MELRRNDFYKVIRKRNPLDFPLCVRKWGHLSQKVIVAMLHTLIPSLTSSPIMLTSPTDRQHLLFFLIRVTGSMSLPARSFSGLEAVVQKRYLALGKPLFRSNYKLHSAMCHAKPCYCALSDGALLSLAFRTQAAYSPAKK